MIPLGTPGMTTDTPSDLRVMFCLLQLALLKARLILTGSALFWLHLGTNTIWLELG